MTHVLECQIECQTGGVELKELSFSCFSTFLLAKTMGNTGKHGASWALGAPVAVAVLLGCREAAGTLWQEKGPAAAF